jgi:tRNA(Ile)-lysidine synthase
MKAVAFSGGVDSTALLLRAVAQAGPQALLALHVHHGLQPAADGFARHCAEVCAGLGVRLQVLPLALTVRPGDSVEAVARTARYTALAQAAREAGAQAVLLGHHADDQAETLLLALSRGAGLPGLAAMPAAFDRHGMRFERPLLAAPRETLVAEVRAAGLTWVDDPSNTDLQRTRNRIRHQVLPILEAAFPQFRDTFARSARHAAQAQTLLDQLALMDWRQGAGAQDLGGQVSQLQALSDERLANALRGWLRREHQAAPSEAQLLALVQQVRAASTRGHRIALRVAHGMVTRGPQPDGPCLRFVPGLPRG